MRSARRWVAARTSTSSTEMMRTLTSAENAALKAAIDQLGPAPTYPPDPCPKCGSTDFMRVFGTGLFGWCEMLCNCGWSANEAQKAYVLKLRAAVKPLLAGFDPPIEQGDNSDLSNL